MKIIEITAEKMTAQQLEEVKTSTLKEIHVLNMVKGHPSISMLDFSHLAPSISYFSLLCDSKVLSPCCDVLFQSR